MLINKFFCKRHLARLSLGATVLLSATHGLISAVTTKDHHPFFFSIDDEKEADLIAQTAPTTSPISNQTPAIPSVPITTPAPANQTTPISNQTPLVPNAPVQAPITTPVTAPTPTTPTLTPTPAAPATLTPAQETPVITPQATIQTRNESTTIIPNIEEQIRTQSPTEQKEEAVNTIEPLPKTILINFNNVNIIEYLRFISRISNKNFIFDENDLQFNVTIISEEPATIDNIMMALLQELRIHELGLIEQGNNLIIHRNPKVNGISKIVTDDSSAEQIGKLQADIITQVFRLNTINGEKAAALIRPLSSSSALVEVITDTNHLVVTDIASNVIQIGKLLKSIDSPQSGLVIGQYVVKQGVPDALINLTQQIMQPIALDQPLTMVSHVGSNSIFIVATPYLVDRTLSIMQYLDQTQGTTQIINLKESFQGENLNGQWELDENGNWRYRVPGKSEATPQGTWSLDSNGNWRFTPGGTPDDSWIKDANGNWIRDTTGRGGPRSPDGQWVKDASGTWIFQLAPGKAIAPEKLTRKEQTAVNLPIGHIERTKFYIYRLHYRQAALIEQSLKKIGQSLQTTNTNADLVAAIDTIQSIETTNSLIFTGTTTALDKLKELIAEVDRPLRQVFLELLILETTLDDSLSFGVNWGTRFGGGNSAGSQAFLSEGSPLVGGLDTTNPINTINPPDATALARNLGYNLGIIGRHLTHGGIHFNSIGALVSALHADRRQNIVLNPKILTEDNSPAEIFVGINTPYPSQSIANDNGNIVTQNFQYLDVGVRFKVTPLIGEGDLVTLDIEEEKTDIIANRNPNITPTQLQNQIIGPSTSKSKTTTRVHMPNGYFLILSGQIEDKITKNVNQVPCLGGIPILGAAFKDRLRRVEKTNLLLFIRPLIIDTYEEMHNITKHQQDIWNNKNCIRESWKYETHEALDFFNLKDALYPNYDSGADCGCE